MSSYLEILTFTGVLACLVLILLSRINAPEDEEKTSRGGKATFIDTSAVIDRRFVALIDQSIISTPVIVLSCVMDELQALADHGDAMKRDRGRKGLTLIRELVRTRSVHIEQHKCDNVDNALLELCSRQNSALVTVDYNLVLRAEVKGLLVISPQRLFTALRPKHAVGEQISITVTHKGTKPRQGVGYSEDGAMVVVEGTSKYVGKTLKVSITKEQRTETGNVLFAELVR